VVALLLLSELHNYHEHPMAATSHLHPTQKTPMDFWQDLATNPKIGKCLIAVQKLQELKNSAPPPIKDSYSREFNTVVTEMKAIKKSLEESPAMIDLESFTKCKKTLNKIAISAFSSHPTDPFSTYSQGLVVAWTQLEMLLS
jgi:hypothetical protein